MALAQPTGLNVQTLEPLIIADQAVEHTVAAGTLITVNQVIDDSAYVDAGGTFVGITQLVDDSAVIRPTQTLMTALQLVDDTATLVPAKALATLGQNVRTESKRARKTLITLEQTTERHAPASRLVRVRQVVKSDVATPAATRNTLITLDDVDITAQCSPAIDVTASESDNRTATVVLFPQSGPINITSYQGRSLEIRREIDGTWTPLFVGTVDVPTYRRDSRTLQLRCSDLRNERLGKEDQAKLQTLTGGLYSPVTQREEATGEQWVRELMKTVEGSLDYTGSGALRFTPWAVTTPKYTLTASDIHHREVSLEFATRSEIINRVPISVGFRWFKRHTFAKFVGASISTGDLCSGSVCLPSPGQALPTKDAAISAAQSLSGWKVISIGTGSPPASGWYRTSAGGKLAYVTSDVFRETYATSVSAELVRYVSQGMRWTDEISVEAPQSIDQFGGIEGSALGFSIDTQVDPGVFEENGCYTRPEQDRLADRELAIQAAERMAAKQIRGSHRQNYASMRYKPAAGDLLPAEIGDTISVTTPEVTVTGWVSELRHATSGEGDRYTDLKLAVSRVDSAVSATDILAVPEVGTPRRINLGAQQSEPIACGSSAAPEEPQASDIALDGSITLVAPAIAAHKTDELVGEASTTYQIAIPVNTFTVEVP